MITLAKRMPGLEEVIAGMKPQRVEERQSAESLTGSVAQVIEQYIRCTEMNRKEIISDFLSKIAVPILLPTEINAFMQLTLPYSDNRMYDEITSSFANRLIQDSYDAGYNGFVLNLTSLPPIEGLGISLRGTADRLLELQFRGTVGWRCCGDAEYCDVIVEDVGSMFADEAKYSHFKIREAKDNCGVKSVQCSFMIDSAGSECGMKARDSKFTVGKIGTKRNYAGWNNIFATTSKETLYDLLYYITPGNRVVFIHSDGREEIRKDYR